LYERAQREKYGFSPEEETLVREEYRRPTPDQEYRQRLYGWLNLDPEENQYSTSKLEQMLVGE